MSDRGPFTIRRSSDGWYYAKYPDGDAPEAVGIWRRLAHELNMPNYNHADNTEGWPLPVISSWASGMSTGGDVFTIRDGVEFTEAGNYFLPVWRYAFTQGADEEALEWGYRVWGENPDLPMYVIINNMFQMLAQAPYTTMTWEEGSPFFFDSRDDSKGNMDVFRNAVAQQAGTYHEAGRNRWAAGFMGTVASRLPNQQRIIALDNNEHRRELNYKHKYSKNYELINPSYDPAKDPGDPDIPYHETEYVAMGQERMELFNEVWEGLKEKARESWPGIPMHRVAYQYGLATPWRIAAWKNYTELSWMLHHPDDIGDTSWDYNLIHDPECSPSPGSIYPSQDQWWTDTTVGSIQSRVQNMRWIMDQFLENNPDTALYEQSCHYNWDYETTKYSSDWGGGLGTFTDERWAAMVCFCLWVERPRIMRDFTGHSEPKANYTRRITALSTVISPIWDVPDITRFWRNGRWLLNQDRQHPWDMDNDDYSRYPRFLSQHRWYQLTTEHDATTDWGYSSNDVNPSAFYGGIIPVFAIAMELGTTPNREWLVYAHCPMGTYTDCLVTIPGYQQVTVPVSVAGTYTLVTEQGSISEVYVNG